MNNMQNNQENLDKNPQGQGGRTEESREGRETMRGAGMDQGGKQNLSSHSDTDTEIDEEDDFEDSDEASLDSAEDEEDSELEGTERSDLGFNRGRDTNREQADRV